EFVGALPEAAVRQFLTKLLPSEADRLATTAEELRATGKLAEAEATFRQALDLDARCDRATLGLARILVEHADHQAALALVDRVCPGPVGQEADRLAAEIRVRQGGGEDEPTLRAQLEANPADLDVRLQLGRVLAAASRYEEALAEYLDIVRRNRS